QMEAWGDDYLAFADQGVDGGFYRSDATVDAAKGSALIIFYSTDLESTERKIVQAEGTIKQPTYHFPGGRRLHFTDPNGNEYAVWSDREDDGSQMG
ncbi:MAG: VOC family protein, partial [Pseudomonadota bacterium]